MILDEMKAKEITPYRLAQLTGLPKSSISYIFREGWGKQIATIQKLCNALGLQINIQPKDILDDGKLRR